MKKITAYIRSWSLGEVKDCLDRIGTEGMTITESKGWGRERSNEDFSSDERQMRQANTPEPEIRKKIDRYRSGPFSRIKIEVVMPDDLVDKAINVISQHAKTGKDGDGIIIVENVLGAVRIRNEDYEFSNPDVERIFKRACPNGRTGPGSMVC